MSDYEHETARMPEYLMPRITLRDYMAAAALTGLMAFDPESPSDSIAGRAYELAAAMLKERNRD